MKKPSNYENTQEYGSFKSLPPGGYVVVIRNAEETKSKKGKPMLRVAIDIAEGEYKNYFADLYRAKKEKDPMKATWPNDGYMYILTEDQSGNCHRAFKSFCGAMEKTGNQVWDAEDNLMTEKMSGKFVGLTFGREQEEYQGKTYTKTKGRFWCTMDDIHSGNFNVPEDRVVENSSSELEIPPGFNSVSDEDLPFM